MSRLAHHDARHQARAPEYVHDLAIEALAINAPSWRRIRSEFGAIADRLR